MANRLKETVDYFPFFVADGRTLYLLKKKYGLLGIGFFAQLLRWLAQTPGHVYPFREDFDKERFLEYVGLTETDAVQMLNDMARTDKIDPEIWNSRRIIFCSDFIDTLSEAYRRRKVERPDSAEIREEILLQYKDLAETAVNMPSICRHDDDIMPVICRNDDAQRKENKIKEKKRKIEQNGKPESEIQSKDVSPLYNTIKDLFIKEQPGERFSNYAKEGTAIKQLIKKAEALDSENPEIFLQGMMTVYSEMRDQEDFYRKQPFTPSALNSSGIWDRVLTEAKNRWDQTQPVSDFEEMIF